MSDAQLEYYLDRSNAGWSMGQISADMAASRRQYPSTTAWRPQTGWTAREVVCTSANGRYRECALPFRGRAMITQQISQAACIEGKTWGQEAGAVWVSRGCRARFASIGRGSRDARRNDAVWDNRNDNGWNRDTSYSVTCQSVDNRRSNCQWDSRYGVPRLAQQISQNSCVEGRDWGYDNRGGLWVDAGCRARFGYR